MDPASTLSAVLGGAQMISGMVKRKQAEAEIPGREDPMSRLFLNQIRRRRRAAETGTDQSANRAAMRQLAKTGMASALKTGGPINAGFLTQFAEQASKNLAESRAQMIANLMQQEGQQVADMTQRKFDIGMYRSQTKKAEAEQSMKAGQSNLLSGVFGQLPVDKNM